MRTLHRFTGLSLIAFLAASTAARAATITVNATDDVYAAGQPTLISGGAAGGAGTAPGSISATGVSSFTFAVTGGPITLDGGGHNNTADGVGGAVASSSNTGFGSLSGVTAPGAGYIVGVFESSGGPSGAAPTALDFTGSTNFTSLSPLLDQVFFIGDGLTGNGSGTPQVFFVPTGASLLFFGFSDSFNYANSPAFYGDNSGTFSLTDTPAASTGATPEPSSFLLLGTGMLGMLAAVAMRRRAPARDKVATGSN